MIVIVDYGLGNVRAFANIYKNLNVPALIATSSDVIGNARKIILPGVGSFDTAMTRLNESGMREELENMVIGKKTPVLGVCVGMQMMASRSDEGQLDGLGWIEGEVREVDRTSSNGKILVPHMGWNDVEPTGEDHLFMNLQDRAQFYFLHSYCFVPKHQEHVIAYTSYGRRLVSGVRSENVAGVQFHPEKSHHWGVQLLKNFAKS